MKKSILYFWLLLIFNSVNAQLETDYKHYQQSSRSAKDISGICDATTVNIDPFFIDICGGTTYEGTVEFESVDGELYNIYSISPSGDRFNDPGFGAYYACYGTDSQDRLANSSATFPTLYFQVDANGRLGYSGASQWGEIYDVSDVKMDNENLEFIWFNHYGEKAMVRLTRHDGKNWKKQLLINTNTTDIPEFSKVQISPNPAFIGDLFNVNIDFDVYTNATLKIIDFSGQIVESRVLESMNENASVSLDTKNLSSGMYIIHITSEHGTVTKKIVFQ